MPRERCSSIRRRDLADVAMVHLVTTGTGDAASPVACGVQAVQCDVRIIIPTAIGRYGSIVGATRSELGAFDGHGGGGAGFKMM